MNILTDTECEYTGDFEEVFGLIRKPIKEFPLQTLNREMGLKFLDKVIKEAQKKNLKMVLVWDSISPDLYEGNKNG